MWVHSCHLGPLLCAANAQEVPSLIEVITTWLSMHSDGKQFCMAMLVSSAETLFWLFFLIGLLGFLRIP
jgi:hypothetical protein